MSEAEDVKKADEARAAVVSDIQELKVAGHQAVGQAKSAVPWIVGGAAGLFVIGGLIALKPRRSFRRPPTLLGKAVRMAALSAVGFLARRLVTRALDKALPEPQATSTRAQVAA